MLSFYQHIVRKLTWQCVSSRIFLLSLRPRGETSKICRFDFSFTTFSWKYFCFPNSCGIRINEFALSRTHTYIQMKTPQISSNHTNISLPIWFFSSIFPHINIYYRISSHEHFLLGWVNDFWNRANCFASVMSWCAPHNLNCFKLRKIFFRCISFWVSDSVRPNA